MCPLRVTPSLRQWILNCLRAKKQVEHDHACIHCTLFLIMDVANPPAFSSSCDFTAMVSSA